MSDVLTENVVTCPLCGIGHGKNSIHSCMGQGANSNFNTYSALLSPMFSIDGETKQLLERIATALEKIADKVKE